MQLTTTTFQCTGETGPKFWVAYSNGVELHPQQIGYIEPGQTLSTGQQYLSVFDDEQSLADSIELLNGITDWYWGENIRIPYPPNPNEWYPSGS